MSPELLSAKRLLITGVMTRTSIASGIPRFEQLAEGWCEAAPLGWGTEDAQPVADCVCLLFSDLVHGITGEQLHADGGYHAMGAPARSSTVEPELIGADLSGARS